VTETGEGIHVGVHWTADVELDRPCTGGFLFGHKKRALVARLVKAIDAQAVHKDPKVVKDIGGKTYVQATSKVMAKYANADLRRLGF
jgi:hypothetical protein